MTASLAERLCAGEVTSVDVTEGYLARIDQLDPQLRAFVTVCADSARAEARAADESLARGELLGPLHGLPVALKDNIDTAGVRTTAGSRFLADNVPDRDADAAERLREAGAVLLGKTALHEFAFGGTTQNPHYGACRNPWDTDRIPGGSSGGSGAALGADLCAAALGTDTGGSVRIPAALNGVSGLRPTFGRVSNRGVFPVSWSLDTVGPMARSVADVALLLSVLAGFDPEDPASVHRPVDDYLSTLDRGVAGLRIGLPASFYFEDVDGEIVSAVRAAADVLAGLGAELVQVDLPEAEAALVAAARIIWSEAFAVHRERLATQPELFGEDVRRRLALGESLTAADYAIDVQTGREWRRTVEAVFGAVDIVVTPVTGTVAPLAEATETIETTRRLTRLTYGWSLAGVPSLSVPCGFSTEGLPIGLHLAAASWQEALLLRVGVEYQRTTDWHARQPPLLAGD